MIYDLAIIGGGPAGITAGIYAARKKLNTLLISKNFTGQASIPLRIENYPGFKKNSPLPGIDSNLNLSIYAVPIWRRMLF